MMTPVMLVIDIDNHDAILPSASCCIDINRKCRELDRIVFKALSKAGTRHEAGKMGRKAPPREDSAKKCDLRLVRIATTSRLT